MSDAREKIAWQFYLFGEFEPIEPTNWNAPHEESRKLRCFDFADAVKEVYEKVVEEYEVVTGKLDDALEQWRLHKVSLAHVEERQYAAEAALAALKELGLGGLL